MLAISSCRRIMRTMRFSTSLVVLIRTSRNKRIKLVRYASQLSSTNINERTLLLVVGPSSARARLLREFWIKARSGAADFGQLPQVLSQGGRMGVGHSSKVSATRTRRRHRSQAGRGVNLVVKLPRRRKSLPQATVSNTVAAITRRWRKDTTA